MNQKMNKANPSPKLEAKGEKKLGNFFDAL